MHRICLPECIEYGTIALASCEAINFFETASNAKKDRVNTNSEEDLMGQVTWMSQEVSNWLVNGL